MSKRKGRPGFKAKKSKKTKHDSLSGKAKELGHSYAPVQGG